ncbi:MAG: amino acid ABC transporter substrate-binding protein [Nannocystis sp.]|nr:amino acid ABC transporter substrate-binding protein [Nannocystis sp.]
MIDQRRLPSLFVAAGLVVTLGGACRSTPSGGTPPRAALAPERIDPEFQRDWEAVRAAQRADPEGAEVVASVDRLLARDPPLALRVAAIHAKVELAARQGDDAASMRWADEAISAVSAAGGPERALGRAEMALWRDLLRLEALAHARSGAPKAALLRLAALEMIGGIDETTLWGARALAYERAEELGEALVAYARWRAGLPAGQIEALFAEERLRALAGAVSREERVQRAGGLDGAVAACLRGEVGQDGPAWLLACGVGSGRRVGILLPRSGRLAALADLHLAAAVAAVRVLADRGNAGDVEVLWVDSGSTPEAVQAAADSLRRRGVDVVVGPVGAGNIGAAAKVLGGALIVIPGESMEGAVGVAPSLEARCAAMVAHARAQRVNGLVVFAPDNAYGKRAARAVARAAEGQGVTIVSRRDYPEATTSFAPVVQPVLATIRQGAGIVVLDRVDRMELLLRQLARDGVAAAGTGKALVMGTGESLEGRSIGPGHEPLEGVWMAPAAWAGSDSAEFSRAYQAQEGQEPGDQALLVWWALVEAWSAQTPRAAAASLIRIQGGRVVPPESQIMVQPRG